MRSPQYTTRNGQSLVSNRGFRRKVKEVTGLRKAEGATRPGSLGAVQRDTVGAGRGSDASIICGYWHVQASSQLKIMDVITREVITLSQAIQLDSRQLKIMQCDG